MKNYEFFFIIFLLLKQKLYILDGILFFVLIKPHWKMKNKWFFFYICLPYHIYYYCLLYIRCLFTFCALLEIKTKYDHTQRKICLAFFVNIKMHEVLLLIIQRLKELWIKVYEFKNIGFLFVVFFLIIHVILNFHNNIYIYLLLNYQGWNWKSWRNLQK